MGGWSGNTSKCSSSCCLGTCFARHSGDPDGQAAWCPLAPAADNVPHEVAMLRNPPRLSSEGSTTSSGQGGGPPPKNPSVANFNPFPVEPLLLSPWCIRKLTLPFCRAGSEEGKITDAEAMPTRAPRRSSLEPPRTCRAEVSTHTLSICERFYSGDTSAGRVVPKHASWGTQGRQIILSVERCSFQQRK